MAHAGRPPCIAVTGLRVSIPSRHGLALQRHAEMSLDPSSASVDEPSNKGYKWKEYRWKSECGRDTDGYLHKWTNLDGGGGGHLFHTIVGKGETHRYLVRPEIASVRGNSRDCLRCNQNPC